MKTSEQFPQCPGEEDCRRYPGLPLNDPRKTPEEACGTCERRLTKPGFFQHVSFDAVQRLAARTMRLDRLRSRGATFAYPDGLEPQEWLGLEILEAAERKYSAEKDAPQVSHPTTKAEKDAAFYAATMKEIKQRTREG